MGQGSLRKTWHSNMLDIVVYGAHRNTGQHPASRGLCGAHRHMRQGMYMQECIADQAAPVDRGRCTDNAECRPICCMHTKRYSSLENVAEARIWHKAAQRSSALMQQSHEAGVYNDTQ